MLRYGEDNGVAYWSAGGPAKTRIRLMEDPQALLRLGAYMQIPESQYSRSKADHQTRLIKQENSSPTKLNTLGVACAEVLPSLLDCATGWDSSSANK
eukprot:2597296-Amphidinium_carterae.1